MFWRDMDTGHYSANIFVGYIIQIFNVHQNKKISKLSPTAANSGNQVYTLMNF